MTEQHVEARSEPPASSPPIWSSPQRWLTLGLILTVVGPAFEAISVATILPATSRELGGLHLYGWAFSAFLLTNLVGITMAGGEADRQGPARPYVAGMLLFTAGLLIGGLAPSMPILVAARALQGLGGGFIGAIAFVAVARGYPADVKPRMLALMSTAWVLPGLIGPAVAGWIGQSLGWRWVFLGLAPLPVLAAFMTLPALRSLGGGTTAPRDWGQIGTATALAAGAGLLLGGLGATSGPLAAALVLGGGLVGLVALRRLLPVGTLSAAPGIPAAILTGGLLNLAFFGVDAFVPLSLSALRGQNATMAGLPLTTATIMWTAGSWLQARLAPVAGRRQLVASGLVVTVIGCGAAALIVLPATPVLLAPIGWGIAGLGMGIAYSTLSLVVLEHAPPGAEWVLTAALQLLNVLGGALGTGIGGALVAHASRAEAGIAGAIVRQDLLMIAVLAIALLTAQRLPGRKGPAHAGQDTAVHAERAIGG